MGPVHLPTQKVASFHSKPTPMDQSKQIPETRSVHENNNTWHMNGMICEEVWKGESGRNDQSIP